MSQNTTHSVDYKGQKLRCESHAGVRFFNALDVSRALKGQTHLFAHAWKNLGRGEYRPAGFSPNTAPGKLWVAGNSLYKFVREIRGQDVETFMKFMTLHLNERATESKGPPAQAIRAVTLSLDEITSVAFGDDAEIRGFLYSEIPLVLAEDVIEAFGCLTTGDKGISTRIFAIPGSDKRMVRCDAWSAPKLAIPQGRLVEVAKDLRGIDVTKIKSWIERQFLPAVQRAGNVGEDADSRELVQPTPQAFPIVPVRTDMTQIRCLIGKYDELLAIKTKDGEILFSEKNLAAILRDRRERACPGGGLEAWNAMIEAAAKVPRIEVPLLGMPLEMWNGSTPRLLTRNAAVQALGYMPSVAAGILASELAAKHAELVKEHCQPAVPVLDLVPVGKEPPAAVRRQEVAATNPNPTSKVFTFEDGDSRAPIRTVSIDGEPWFVGNDVCAVLEITDARQAVARLDDDERGGFNVPTPSGHQEMRCINESGLYSLILTSRKPVAKRFKKWVTADVLPSIRKTGAYSITGANLPAPTTPFIDLGSEKARATHGGIVKKVVHSELEPVVQEIERLHGQRVEDAREWQRWRERYSREEEEDRQRQEEFRHAMLQWQEEQRRQIDAERQEQERWREEMQATLAKAADRIMTPEQEELCRVASMLSGSQVIERAGFPILKGMPGGVVRKLKAHVDSKRVVKRPLVSHSPTVCRFFPDDVDEWLANGGRQWLHAQAAQKASL